MEHTTVGIAVAYLISGHRFVVSKSDVCVSLIKIPSRQKCSLLPDNDISSRTCLLRGKVCLAHYAVEVTSEEVAGILTLEVVSPIKV